ncbi:hypothetical protein PCASD_24469 [Puccinia coronata f. sp. avenae]|uniref:Uncharacterized protein n=1 Tax=Puccinia coronata f. sp. avenae TaxID=200324 RepID=A0A2N5S9Z8_9BASI|nr:hypothetical protein PCASD_24469 [Puccinia coronata f. sp. avenae]
MCPKYQIKWIASLFDENGCKIRYCPSQVSCSSPTYPPLLKHKSYPILKDLISTASYKYEDWHQTSTKDDKPRSNHHRTCKHDTISLSQIRDKFREPDCYDGTNPQRTVDYRTQSSCSSINGIPRLESWGKPTSSHFTSEFRTSEGNSLRDCRKSGFVIFGGEKRVKLYETILKSQPSHSASQSISSTAVIVANKRPGDEILSAAQSTEKKAKGPSFDPTMVNIHAHIGFSQFFDRNLKELRSPLPLTIFDTKWQAAALSYQAQPRTKSTSSLGNNMRYSRLPYQSEWTLSYVAWEKMYRCFIQTLRDVYHHGGFVVWLMQHKEHADQL